MSTILEARSISYTYPDGTRAIEDVSLEVEEGRVYAILGPNGSGKSTLLLLLAGLLRPESGEVLYRGKPIGEVYRRMRREVGIVFQDPDDQLFAPTVREDLAFGPKQLGIEEGELEERIERVAEELSISHLLDKPPYRLSGGERKLVALATVLVMEPRVLLLDEPFAELAPDASIRLEKLLKRLGDRTIIFSGHDTDMAARAASEVILLNGGRIVGAGRAEEVLSDEGLMSASGLSPPIVARIYRMLGGRARPPVTVEELIERLRAERLIRGPPRS